MERNRNIEDLFNYLDTFEHLIDFKKDTGKNSKKSHDLTNYKVITDISSFENGIQVAKMFTQLVYLLYEAQKNKIAIFLIQNFLQHRKSNLILQFFHVQNSESMKNSEN